MSKLGHRAARWRSITPSGFVGRFFGACRTLATGQPLSGASEHWCHLLPKPTAERHYTCPCRSCSERLAARDRSGRQSDREILVTCVNLIYCWNCCLLGSPDACDRRHAGYAKPARGPEVRRTHEARTVARGKPHLRALPTVVFTASREYCVGGSTPSFAMAARLGGTCACGRRLPRMPSGVCDDLAGSSVPHLRPVAWTFISRGSHPRGRWILP